MSIDLVELESDPLDPTVSLPAFTFHFAIGVDTQLQHNQRPSSSPNEASSKQAALPISIINLFCAEQPLLFLHHSRLSSEQQKRMSMPGVYPPIPEWRYEHRREAQQILPNLYVGPYQSSRNLEYMQSLNLTHVLCISDPREALFVKPRFPESFTYKVLDMRDAQDQNIIRLFPEARAFIDAALAARGTVLVHCGDGISRSPAIVTAYVMCTLNIPQEEAFQYVQSRRFCISPNPGFQHQIEAYQHIHEAQKQCASDPAMNQREDVRRKRSDEFDEDDMREDAIENEPSNHRVVSGLPSRNKSRRLSPQDMMFPPPSVINGDVTMSL